MAATDVIVAERILVSGVTTSTGGFVGDLTGDLTGDVTGNVTGNTSGTAGGLSGSPDISVNNLTVVSDVSIGGTLTYEDVTNVDSVGLITARNGIEVLANGINAVGIVTATEFDGQTELRTWLFG